MEHSSVSEVVSKLSAVNLSNELSVAKSVNSSQQLTGLALPFLQHVISTNNSYKDWDPVRDIKNQASEQVIEECRSLLWGANGDNKEL